MAVSLNIDAKLSKQINDEVAVFLEPGYYAVCEDVCCESPCSVRGVNMFFPFSCGAFTHINPNGLIQNCTIGRYCAIATGVKIGNGNHPTSWLSVNACQYIPNFHGYQKLFGDKIKIQEFTCFKHTVIGNDVWIGANVYIKDGVKIGDGAVIGANSVVTHDVEPYAIMAGAPAKLLRYRFAPEIIRELTALKWWEYSIADFGDIDFSNIEKAISQLKERLPKLKKYTPKKVDYAYFVALKKRQNIVMPGVQSQPRVKKKLFGLIKNVKHNGQKTKYFMGIKIYTKEIKK